MSRDPQPVTLAMIFGALLSIARAVDRLALAVEALKPQKPA